MKHSFYTEDFYLNPLLTVSILNALNKDGHVADKDMYGSGQFLFMEVHDNEKTREILSQVISDFDLYKKHNKEDYPSDKDTGIGLCALQGDHCSHHGNEDEIMWNSETEEFVTAGEFYNDEEE